jgi:hypothetical protein
VTCPDPAECLAIHIGPRLRDWWPSGDRPHQYRARCPAHDDRKASLTVGIGDSGRITWHCFTGCTTADVRAALCLAGVLDSCLPPMRAQRTEDELVSDLVMIL